ncbi:hypothetical protein SAMN05216198_1352 [Halopseudomonas litoralis]|uniref:Uncharacterized protein n=1 Tax=Halopseudomonas litoralis TaxID=797277 RepID=A0A1H1Q192_9GAMM|nr:methyltransferase [Halopseudomonas litoralis]SDS17258.1 hypothetical protein SAMN05216198_1352 [Halopseudomonas litoralis]
MLSNLLKRRKPQQSPLFTMGSLQLSEKVRWLASKGLIEPLPYVLRHVRGDWGDVEETARQANDDALEQGAPMTSCFSITPRLILMVITSDDHSKTLVQLIDEQVLG